MRHFKNAGLVFIVSLFFGCNAMIMKSASSADDTKAKLFVPDSTRALVYVFRDNSFLGRDLTSQFVVNNVAVAKNERNQFNIISLAPGKYDFFSISANESRALNMLIHNSHKTPVQLTIESGKIYFFQEVFKALEGFTLKSISAEEAAPVIRKGKLLAIHQI